MQHVLDFFLNIRIWVVNTMMKNKCRKAKSLSRRLLLYLIFITWTTHTGLHLHIYTVIQMKINFNYWNVFERFRYCPAVGRINFLIGDLLDSHLIKASTLLFVLSDKACGLRKFLAEYYGRKKEETWIYTWECIFVNSYSFLTYYNKRQMYGRKWKSVGRP